MTARPWIIAGAALALVSGTLAAAQQEGERQRLAPECRQQIADLCGTDRSQMRQCLMTNFSRLSDGCQSAIKERMQQRMRARREHDGQAGALGGMMAPPTGEPSPSDSPSPE